jgi:hypothetical protein
MRGFLQIKITLSAYVLKVIDNVQSSFKKSFELFY